MASRGHEILVKTENYLSSIGKSNSTGKYDRIVQGVKSLLEQGFLEGDRLEGAIKQEADRLLKKYNLDAKTADKVYDPVLCMMVDADKVSTRDRYFDVSYSVGDGIFSGVMVQANSEQEAIEKAKKHDPHIARAEKVAASPSSMSVESARMRGKSVIDKDAPGYYVSWPRGGGALTGAAYSSDIKYFRTEAERNAYVEKLVKGNVPRSSIKVGKYENFYHNADSSHSLDRAIKTMDSMSVNEIKRKLDAFEFGTGIYRTENTTKLKSLARGLYDNIVMDLGGVSDSERRKLVNELNKACRSLGLDIVF